MKSAETLKATRKRLLLEVGKMDQLDFRVETF